VPEATVSPPASQTRPSTVFLTTSKTYIEKENYYRSYYIAHDHPEGDTEGEQSKHHGLLAGVGLEERDPHGEIDAEENLEEPHEETRQKVQIVVVGDREK
jgi:hypothetical protein